MNRRSIFAIAAVVTLAVGNGPAWAAVSADEAAALGGSLTPLGAEKAGNKDGTIPEWTGRIVEPPAKGGDIPADPFASEKPLYRITAQNMAQYADKLSEGVQELLKKYPTYWIDVYPTHRTHTAPKEVYDHTRANASRASVSPDGLRVSGAFGGVPFPIPKQGVEVFWNHTLKPTPPTYELKSKNLVGSSDGRQTLASHATSYPQYPYYLPGGSLEKWDGTYLTARTQIFDPPFKSGESLLVHDSVDPDNARKAWQYLVGQRRVRRAPTVGYDTPDFIASGANYFDEVNGLWGDPSRFEWKLVGKKELFIPYNENTFFSTPVDSAFVPYHPNPEKVRWELHRVWVVDATLAPGKRHAVPKRRYYFDEDTWGVAIVDGYDANGKLWRNSQVFPIYVGDVGMAIAIPTIVYNFQANTYSTIQFPNGDRLKVVPPKPGRFYSSDALGEDNAR